MFELTKELLIGLLVVLAAVLIIIIYFIFRKQHELKRLQSGEAVRPEIESAKGGPPKGELDKMVEEAQAAKPKMSETGPTDAKSIKERILSVVRHEHKPEEAPKPGPVPEPAAEPAKEPGKPKPVKRKAPPAAKRPAELGEGIEAGMDLGEETGMVKPFPAGPDMREEKPEEVREAEEAGKGIKVVELGEAKKAPERPKPMPSPEPAAPSARPEAPAQAPPGKPSMPPPKPGKAVRKNASELAELPESMYGSPVMVEGSVRLSSRSSSGFWYVLFDDSGSVVVRSLQEIPYEQVRLTATARQTRLGQTYLEVQKVERL